MILMISYFSYVSLFYKKSYGCSAHVVHDLYDVKIHLN